MLLLTGTNGLTSKGDNMNGLKVLFLKGALDKICEELYEELPLGYAKNAIRIIKRNINKILSQVKFGSHE